MSCGVCASIRRSVLQTCVDINPVSFALAIGPSTTTITSAYQSSGGNVTASGIVNVQGTISTDTDVVLTFLQGAVTIGTITLGNVTDDSTWGFSELTQFDSMNVTITNGDIANPSTGTLDIVMVINS